MRYGFFTDKGLDKQNLIGDPWNKLEWHPDINSYGYRCPEWEPMPDGKKNVVILGCSHTFGQGLLPDQHWVHFWWRRRRSFRRIRNYIFCPSYWVIYFRYWRRRWRRLCRRFRRNIRCYSTTNMGRRNRCNKWLGGYSG